MVETLKESINSIRSPYLKDESYKIAAMIHPIFKLRWCDSEDMEKNVLLLKQKSVSIKATSVKVDDDAASPPQKIQKSEI